MLTLLGAGPAGSGSPAVPEPSLTVPGPITIDEGGSLDLSATTASYAGSDLLTYAITSLNGVFPNLAGASGITLSDLNIALASYTAIGGNYAGYSGPDTITVKVKRDGQVAWADTKTIAVTVKPLAPSSLVITPNATTPTTSLDANWTNNSADYTKTEVGYGDTALSSQSAVNFEDSGVAVETNVVAALDPATTQYISIRARKDGTPNVYSDWVTATGTTASPITLNDTDPLVETATEGDTGTIVNLTAATDPNGTCTPTIAADGANLAMSGLGVVWSGDAVPGAYAPVVTFTDDTYPAITADQNITLTVKPLAPTVAITDNHDGTTDNAFTNNSTGATHFEFEYNLTPSGGSPTGWSPIAANTLASLSSPYQLSVSDGDLLEIRGRVKVIDGGDIWSDYGTDSVTISI